MGSMGNTHEDLLSLSQLRRDMYTQLRNTGVVDEMKSKMRAQLVDQLRKRGGANGVGAGTENERAPRNVWERVTVSLIMDYLRSTGLSYTLSVFKPEVGLSSKSAELSRQEVLELLNVKGTKLSNMIGEENVQQGNGGSTEVSLAERLYEALSKEQARKKGTETETQTWSVGEAALASQLQTLDEHYLARIQRQQRAPFELLEERMAEYRKECDERVEAEVELRTRRLREVELSNVRTTEAAKYRSMVNDLRTELEDENRERATQLASREESQTESFRAREKRFEAEAYEQRQQLLKERSDLMSAREAFKNEQKATLERIHVQENFIKEREGVLHDRETHTASKEQQLNETLEAALAKRRQLLEREYDERTKLVDAERALVDEDRRKAIASRSQADADLARISTDRRRAEVAERALEESDQRCVRLREEILAIRESGYSFYAGGATTRTSQHISGTEGASFVAMRNRVEAFENEERAARKRLEKFEAENRELKQRASETAKLLQHWEGRAIAAESMLESALRAQESSTAECEDLRLQLRKARRSQEEGGAVNRSSIDSTQLGRHYHHAMGERINFSIAERSASGSLVTSERVDPPLSGGGRPVDSPQGSTQPYGKSPRDYPSPSYPVVAERKEKMNAKTTTAAADAHYQGMVHQSSSSSTIATSDITKNATILSPNVSIAPSAQEVGVTSPVTGGAALLPHPATSPLRASSSPHQTSLADTSSALVGTGGGGGASSVAVDATGERRQSPTASPSSLRLSPRDGNANPIDDAVKDSSPPPPPASVTRPPMLSLLRSPEVVVMRGRASQLQSTEPTTTTTAAAARDESSSATPPARERVKSPQSSPHNNAPVPLTSPHPSQAPIRMAGVDSPPPPLPPPTLSSSPVPSSSTPPGRETKRISPPPPSDALSVGAASPGGPVEHVVVAPSDSSLTPDTIIHKRLFTSGPKFADRAPTPASSTPPPSQGGVSPSPSGDDEERARILEALRIEEEEDNIRRRAEAAARAKREDEVKAAAEQERLRREEEEEASRRAALFAGEPRSIDEGEMFRGAEVADEVNEENIGDITSSDTSESLGHHPSFGKLEMLPPELPDVDDADESVADLTVERIDYDDVIGAQDIASEPSERAIDSELSVTSAGAIQSSASEGSVF